MYYPEFIEKEGFDAPYPFDETDMISEHRRVPRAHLNVTVDVSFYNRGKLFRSRIVNLSEEGTRLEFNWEYGNAVPVLSVGRVMECYVLTPRGSTKFRGMIRWMRLNGKHLYWGMHYTERSDSDNDPLTLLIEEVLHDRTDVPVAVAAAAAQG